MHSMQLRRKLPRTLAATSVLIVSVLALTAASQQKATEKTGAIEFTDARQQAEEFIRYFQTIQLTPEQEAVKRDALLPLPAPCCSENSAYTCCCPCNLSRTVWGLSAYLITERDYDAEAVREAVQRWVRFLAPEGFSGNVCSTKGCGRPFNQNGCGGMSAAQIVW